MAKQIDSLRTPFTFKLDDKTKLLSVVDAYLTVSLNPTCSRALEVGVYKGGWIFTMKSNLKGIQIDALDPYPNLSEIKNTFLFEVNKLNAADSIKLFKDWETYFKQIQTGIKYQIIHLDGEHYQSAASNDLSKVMTLMSPEGILIIDDIFYHSYPGVTAAAFEFLKDSQFKAFLFTEKKLYLCKQNYYDIYYQRSIDLLSQLEIDFTQDELLVHKNTSYTQSNSIYGSSLVILQTLNDWRIIRLMKKLHIGIPRHLWVKGFLRLFLPPVVLISLKYCKYAVSNRS